VGSTRGQAWEDGQWQAGEGGQWWCRGRVGAVAGWGRSRVARGIYKRWCRDVDRDGSRVLEEPAGDLCDGGAFGVAIGGLVGEGGVPSSGGEASAGGEVAVLRRQEDRCGGGHDAAHTEVGVHEGAPHEVHAVVRGVGTRVGEIRQGLRRESFEVEEVVREMVKTIRDTSCARFGYKNDMRAIMEEGGRGVRR
jgi:hypothetical protein